MSSETVVIVSGARTPMGGLQGSLAPVSAVELGTLSIAAAIRRAAIEGGAGAELTMGCVLPAGLEQGPARQAAINAGVPPSTGCTTLNELCGSGMQAAIFAHGQILAGTSQVMVVGGMESMSNAPPLIPGLRSGLRLGHGELKELMFIYDLDDAFYVRLLYSIAQSPALDMGLTREEMDAFAIESLRRAQAAIQEGKLDAEIVPVT